MASNTRHLFFKIMTKYLAIFLFSSLVLSSCNSDAVYEQSIAIKDRSWTYDQKPSFAVKIEDNNAKYDLFINLRHTNAYDYSNFFVLLKEKGKGVKDTSYRKQILLAALDGQWYGNSAGSLYEIQHLAKENFTFPDTGVYTFTLEQNMRDNPLKEITDIGIKLVKK